MCRRNPRRVERAVATVKHLGDLVDVLEGGAT